MRCLLLFLSATISVSGLKAASISVTNPSFESGTTGWTGLGSHSVNSGLSPRPDGTTNNAWSNGTDGYQETVTAVEANTTYTLTVDVGKRSDTGFPMTDTELRLGVGSTFGENLLLLSGEVRPVPSAGWVLWTATFESGNNPPSGNLRIELLAGGVQPQFDDVRLVSSTSSFNPSVAWDIFVPNYSFESPDANDGSTFNPDRWARTADGGLDINGLANCDSTPDPSDSEQTVYSNGGDWYIALNGSNLESKRTYRLTVDLGDRTGLSFGGGELRLGTGSTFGLNLLDATVVNNTVPTNGGGASDGWETWESTFSVGSGIIGDFLRIELVNPGGVQTLFDNVRLEVLPPPAKGTIFMIQ